MSSLKNLTVMLCILAMTALTACGANASNTEAQPEEVNQSNVESNKAGNANDHEQGEQKVFDQKFGEPFNFSSGNSNVMITLSEYEVVTERHAEDRYKDDTDYLKVFLQVENVGEQNSSDSIIDFGSFKAFNANGVEISKLTAFTSLDIRYVDGEFKAAELRPGGRNEGYLYIPIEEGTTPIEIIFYESTNRMLIEYTKQYVLKMT